jgi:OmcA/MtrC family decaheme c-type cytochrome
VLPAAKLITGVLGLNYQGFVKLDHPEYKDGIRLREPAFAMLTASGGGNTARRTIVEAARCNKCHDQLGVEPSFHSGARNNPAGCAIGGCHYETRSTGHVGGDNNFGGGWAVSAKSMVHAIHGASKRTKAFNYEATANPRLRIVAYPGVLNNREQCHVPGSYDFNIMQRDDEPARTTDQRQHDEPGSARRSASPWIKIPKGRSISNPVSSPIPACFACHDSSTATPTCATAASWRSRSRRHWRHAGRSARYDRPFGLDAKNVETCLVTASASGVHVVVHQVKGVQLNQGSPITP